MRYALIADIHANLHALEAVLRDTETAGAERIVCLGDIVGYGAQPLECTEIIRRLGCSCVGGNHEEYTTSFLYESRLGGRGAASNPVAAGINHARAQLSGEDLSWLGKLPGHIDMDGWIIAHASLHDTGKWPYLQTDSDAEPTLGILDGRVGFFGHTHRQKIFRLPAAAPPEEIAPGVFQLPEHTAFAVTVGSVGQPRDPGPEAAWTMWDPEARTVTFRRVPYDHAAAAAAITAAGLPAGSAQRLLR
jgi:diadenosine tetraphosphatase ApaH/serine/threonine PP2A family protein phosphatase